MLKQRDVWISAQKYHYSMWPGHTCSYNICINSQVYTLKYTSRNNSFNFGMKVAFFFHSRFIKVQIRHVYKYVTEILLYKLFDPVYPSG